MKIDALMLTVRSNRLLAEAGIETVEQLLEMNWHDLNSMKGMGDRSMSEIAWQIIRVMKGRCLEEVQQYNAEMEPYARRLREEVYEAIDAAIGKLSMILNGDDSRRV